MDIIKTYFKESRITLIDKALQYNDVMSSLSKVSPPAQAMKRFCTSFSSWFVVPEQGMKDLDILNRGSAFLIPSKSEKFPHKYHVLTASHIVSPWRWPKLYGDDFLRFINEKNTHYTIEFRHDDGSLMTQLECLPRSYHHPSRDLAVLHLEDEKGVDDFATQIGLQILQLTPRPGRGQVL